MIRVSIKHATFIFIPNDFRDFTLVFLWIKQIVLWRKDRFARESQHTKNNCKKRKIRQHLSYIFYIFHYATTRKKTISKREIEKTRKKYKKSKNLIKNNAQNSLGKSKTTWTLEWMKQWMNERNFRCKMNWSNGCSRHTHSR